MLGCKVLEKNENKKETAGIDSHRRIQCHRLYSGRKISSVVVWVKHPFASATQVTSCKLNLFISSCFGVILVVQTVVMELLVILALNEVFLQGLRNDVEVGS